MTESPYQPAPATPAPIPTAPAADPRSGLFVLPPDRTQAIIRTSVAAVLLLGGILCQVAGSNFPSNAPVEMAINFGITLVLVGAAIALGVAAVMAATRPSTATRMRAVSPLAIVGAVLTGVALVAFLATAGNWIEVLTDSNRGRYDGLAWGLFGAGIPWGVGLVFATVSLRLPRPASRAVAIATIAVGILLIVPAIAAAAIYSAGITD